VQNWRKAGSLTGESGRLAFAAFADEAPASQVISDFVVPLAFYGCRIDAILTTGGPAVRLGAKELQQSFAKQALHFGGIWFVELLTGVTA
jgi:hypothetical protein